MDAGARLGRYLTEKRLTQIEFAAKSGIPQCQISLYVTGKRKPGRDNANAIETATGGAIRASAWSVPQRRRRSPGLRPRHS